MKVTMNIECSPEEARAFLGLPNVAPINEMMVEKVSDQLESNMDMMNPAEVMQHWMNFGGLMRDQFLHAMTTAAGAALHEDADAKSAPAAGSGRRGGAKSGA